MLKSHFAAVEKYLLARSEIAANAGHPVHKGTAREWFIRDFLESHLSERVAVGTGEVIEASSDPGKSRNQIDAVVFKRDYPRLYFASGVTGFLAESVVAAIEIKSTLTKDDLADAIAVADRLKKLQRHIVQSFSAGYQPPSILCFLVAFNGPAGMDTVLQWTRAGLEKHNISIPTLLPQHQRRIEVPAPGLDGVFVLGKGMLCFDTLPITLIQDSVRAANPNYRWFYADLPDSALLFLFLLLTTAVSSVSGSWLNPLPYVQRVQYPNVQFEP